MTAKPRSATKLIADLSAMCQELGVDHLRFPVLREIADALSQTSQKKQREALERAHALGRSDGFEDGRRSGHLDGRSEAQEEIRRALGILAEQEIEILIDRRVERALREREFGSDDD